MIGQACTSLLIARDIAVCVFATAVLGPAIDLVKYVRGNAR